MIYMDNAAMVKPTQRVIDKVNDVMRDAWFNPSSAYKHGETVKAYIEEARKNVADLIGADPSEIHFTSGATESANILLRSFTTDDIYVTSIEHPCVDEPSRFWCGYLPVDKYGVIYSSEMPLFNEAKDNGGSTVLFIIYANNEVGTIQPMNYIGNVVCKNRDFLLASDLTQAFGHVPINVKELNISFAFGSGQKIGGLSGCGWLYVAKNCEHLIRCLCDGGEQDVYKSGTENITGIVALGEASKEAKENMASNIEIETGLRDYMIKKILSEIPDTILIGHPTDRLPNNVNIGFGDCDSESIIQYLDLYDICASAGSACHTHSVDVSPVLRNLRLPIKYIEGSVRFTLSANNTKEEVDEVVEVLKQCCEQMRKEKKNKR